MRFRFCGDADCPDWVLAEINTLSRLSSIKLKQLGQIVAEGLIRPPINIDKAEKLFTDSKLDLDLRACIACISYIILSTARFNCDHGALFSELQQLGLPREHSMSIKKVVDEHNDELTTKLQMDSLKVNGLEEFKVVSDKTSKTAVLEVKINNQNEALVLSPLTVEVLLDNLKLAKTKMLELVSSSYSYT